MAICRKTVLLLTAGLCCGIVLSMIKCVCARTAQENLDAMTALTDKFGALIEGDDEVFKKYVKSKHSKYSVVVMFNALDERYKCEVCREAKDEFQIAANSYAATKMEEKLFFVVFDYDTAPNSFHTMKLTHAPEFVIFPNKQKKKKKRYDTYDVMRNGLEADGILKWLHETTGTKIPVKRPIPWDKLMVPGVLLLLLLVLMIVKPGLCLAIITSSSLWGTVILLCVLAMTSGQMWNTIRSPMNAGYGRDGSMKFIMESDGAQFRYESYIIILLNGVISIGFIMLNQATSIKQTVLKNGVGFCGLCLVFVVFGFLLSVFRMKNHGYPYYLIFP